MGKIARQFTLEDLIAAHVLPGTSVDLGGLHFHNTPMALVREIIRQKIGLSLLIPPLGGSINADQLIGAGLVEALRFAYVGGEIFGLAGRFRAAAEAGTICLRDCEEAGFTLALRAGAAALPRGFLPIAGDIPTALSVNPLDYQTIIDPFSGAPTVVVRAITPAVAPICQPMSLTLTACWRAALTRGHPTVVKATTTRISTRIALLHARLTASKNIAWRSSRDRHHELFVRRIDGRGDCPCATRWRCGRYRYPRDPAERGLWFGTAERKTTGDGNDWCHRYT